MLPCHPQKRPQPREETKKKLELSKIDFCLRLEIYQSKILKFNVSSALLEKHVEKNNSWSGA
jgi:hypothetical protein